jgi:hypothetical protein
MSATANSVNPKRKASNTGRTRNQPASKKGATAPDLEMTEENMQVYKAMQAKLNAQKKAAAASQDEGKLFLITTSCSD